MVKHFGRAQEYNKYEAMVIQTATSDRAENLTADSTEEIFL